MSKYLLYMAAGFSLALSASGMADDGPPTLGEMVGYALTLSGNAAQGDKRSLAELQANAATKDPGSEFGLGKAYEFGFGVPKDYAQAMRLYLQATALPQAEMHIGDFYAYGEGVQKDEVQADGWYRKAAQGGSITADIKLGYMYEQGLRVKQDYQQAAQWYRKAADVRNADGEYRLGHVYEQPGSLQDYKQAAEWYQKASQQGIADAQFSLGSLYSSGKGVPADANKAVQQFQMAANQGEVQAMCRFAQSFADGSGVPVDPFRAYQWFTLTQMSPFNHNQDCDAAPTRMKQLEQQLGPAQVARAKQAADAWRNSYTSRDHKQGDLPPF